MLEKQQSSLDSAPKVKTSFGKETLSGVKEDLETLKPLLASYIPTVSHTTSSVLEHVFSRSGKMIRPALFFYLSRMLNYRGDHLMPIAAVCEYIHTASLLHDDVIDESHFRRNRPTTNSLWGDQVSVLVGDLIYSRASEMMAETGSDRLVHTFAKSIRLMSEGELLQLENSFNADIETENYFRIIENKTAVLISACCQAAGLLASASDEVISKLETFGSCVGKAFQLVDDALDFSTSNKGLGKPTQNDLCEGKITLPVIFVRQLADQDEWSKVVDFSEKGFGTEGTSFVSSLVEKYGTVDKTLKEARRLSDLAVDSLSCFSDSPAKEQLILLTEQLVWRKV